jgi:hypothetical protein
MSSIVPPFRKRRSSSKISDSASAPAASGADQLGHVDDSKFTQVELDKYVVPDITVKELLSAIPYVLLPFCLFFMAQYWVPTRLRQIQITLLRPLRVALFIIYLIRCRPRRLYFHRNIQARTIYLYSQSPTPVPLLTRPLLSLDVLRFRCWFTSYWYLGYRPRVRSSGVLKE